MKPACVPDALHGRHPQTPLKRSKHAINRTLLGIFHESSHIISYTPYTCTQIGKSKMVSADIVVVQSAGKVCVCMCVCVCVCMCHTSSLLSHTKENAYVAIHLRIHYTHTYTTSQNIAHSHVPSRDACSFRPNSRIFASKSFNFRFSSSCSESQSLSMLSPTTLPLHTKQDRTQ